MCAHFYYSISKKGFGDKLLFCVVQRKRGFWRVGKENICHQPEDEREQSFLVITADQLVSEQCSLKRRTRMNTHAHPGLPPTPSI